MRAGAGMAPSLKKKRAPHEAGQQSQTSTPFRAHGEKQAACRSRITWPPKATQSIKKLGGGALHDGKDKMEKQATPYLDVCSRSLLLCHNLPLSPNTFGLQVPSSPHLLSTVSQVPEEQPRQVRLARESERATFEQRSLLAGPFDDDMSRSSLFLHISILLDCDGATMSLFQSRLSLSLQTEAPISSRPPVAGLPISVSEVCLTSFPLLTRLGFLGDGSETPSTASCALLPVAMRPPQVSCHVSKNVSTV
jgi:hypothetical protein